LEPFGEWAWCCFSGILFGIHHHYILQPIAIVSTLIFENVLFLLHSLQATQVNLNYILCPAVVDPFRGPYYRSIAVFHQALCLLTLGKIYTLVIKFFLQSMTNWQNSKRVHIE
jgi:hypothetical protein